MKSITKIREFLLNGALAALVICSILLSAKVWFPTKQEWLKNSDQAQIESSSADVDLRLPNIFRPELIIIQRADGQAAFLQAESDLYKQVWPQLLAVLTGTLLDSSLPPSDERRLATAPVEEARISLVLPVTLRLNEWAARWGWHLQGLRYGEQKADLIMLHMGAPAILYFSDPTGNSFRLGQITEGDLAVLRELIAQVAPAQFVQPSTLGLDDIAARIRPGILFPRVSYMPSANVQTGTFDLMAEAARFFPDLSTVRQIDEQASRNMTDGQRLLHLSTNGILEYRTAHTTGMVSDFAGTLNVAHRWISSRGGWPDGLIFNGYTQQSGRTGLQFGFRFSGPFPVETTGDAVRLDLTANDVIHFRRYPKLTSITFGPLQIPVITPEQALRAGAKEISALAGEMIRDVHPAYFVRAPSNSDGHAWSLEPVWVIRIGDARLYVAARVLNSPERRFVVLVR